MRKLLKSTIGAMAVGLGMMMVVGCENPNGPMNPGEITKPQEPALTKYTVNYNIDLTNFETAKLEKLDEWTPNGKQYRKQETILSSNREDALKLAKKELLPTDLNNKAKLGTEEKKDIPPIAEAYWEEAKDSTGTTITLTAKWKFNSDLQVKFGEVAGEMAEIGLFYKEVVIPLGGVLNGLEGTYSFSPNGKSESELGKCSYSFQLSTAPNNIGIGNLLEGDITVTSITKAN